MSDHGHEFAGLDFVTDRAAARGWQSKCACGWRSTATTSTTKARDRHGAHMIRMIEGAKRRAAPAVTPDDVADAMVNLVAMLTGQGSHAEHRREQVGDCVRCSCGARVQGTAVGL